MRLSVRSAVFYIVVLLVAVQQTAGVLWGSFRNPPPQHGVLGSVRLLNSKTIRLENFSYDGRGIAVFVYYYRPGVRVDGSDTGVIIPVPGGNSDGSFVNGRRYTDETITLSLPDGIDACDISTLTIWCRPFRAIFNQAVVRRDVFENNGADPCTVLPQHIEVPLTTPAPPEFDNCRFLHESLQMRWRVNRDESNVRFQLCGCLSSNPNVDQYMGFGLSGSTSSTLMFGADPTITWVDTNSQPNAVDYHLSAYSQCIVTVGEGACPDTVDSRGTCTNDATVVRGFRDDSQQCVTFTRPFTPSDVGTCDQALNPDNQNQYIVWGVGGLGETAFRHFTRAQASDTPLHLGRASLDECGDTSLTCQSCPPYLGQQIIALEDTTFRAVIGPSGNERGYMGITGQAGWGIAWFINGSLIPELVVQRGRNYTFIVEGGDNPNMLSIYHPFYITDSITGGRLRASNDTRANENVYAGFDGDRETAFGRLCELDETPEALASRTSCQNLTDYQDRLVETSLCSQGQPGQLTWTPDADTPNLVYYQCATHQNLGWKIIVLNEGDPLPPTPTIPPTVAMTTVTQSSAATMVSISLILCLVVALVSSLVNVN